MTYACRERREGIPRFSHARVKGVWGSRLFLHMRTRDLPSLPSLHTHVSFFSLFFNEIEKEDLGR